MLTFFAANTVTAIANAMNRAIMIVLGNSGTLGVGVVEEVGVLDEVGMLEDPDATAVTKLAVS